MNQNQNAYDFGGGYGAQATTAALASEWERTLFIRRTYAHLAGALALFAVIDAAILTLVPHETLLNSIQKVGQGWLLVILAFFAVSTIANRMAMSTTSLATQYLGLGLYVVVQSLIFVPLLFVANNYFPGAIPTAAIMTGIIFGGLTAMVFLTRADFSWMGRFLSLFGLAALGFILCSIFVPGLGGNMIGVGFMGFMVLLMSGYILYYTSRVLHHFHTSQYVAASLALFTSVATLFWYVLQLVMSFSND